MWWFDSESAQAQAYVQIVNSDPKENESFGHELVARGAAYYAAREYADHFSIYGPPASYAEAKELIAGFACAFLDRVVEVEPRTDIVYDRRQIQDAAVEQCQENGLDDDYNQ